MPALQERTEHGPQIIRFQRPIIGQPDADEPLTLRHYYERFILPELLQDGIKPASLKEDRTALGHWERSTGDPDIREATREHTTRLRDDLRDRGLSPYTLKKTWCELRMMFGWALDEGVIERVPYISRRRKSSLVDLPPKEQREPLNDGEVTRLFGECRHATYPRVRGLPTPLLWQAAVVLFYVYGIRTRDLFTLRWEDVLFSDGLIRFEAMKTSKLQGLPMTVVTEQWLRKLRAVQTRSGRVFPGFNTRGHQWQTGVLKGQWKRGYYATWRSEICAAAGIGDVWLKHFREAMVTRYNGLDRSEGIGSWIAGHYVPGVSAQNYDLPTREIRALLESASYPACFNDIDAKPRVRLPAATQARFPST